MVERIFQWRLRVTSTDVVGVILCHSRKRKMINEMIKQYLEHHFEPKLNDNFKMEPITLIVEAINRPSKRS